MTLVVPDEVTVDLSAMTLDQLAERANAEAALAETALTSALVHAMNVGDALLMAKAKVPFGKWGKWVAENFDLTKTTADRWVRCAYYREELVRRGATTAGGALNVIRDLPPLGGPAANEHPPEMVDEARRLRGEGHTLQEIADYMGVAKDWVWKVTATPEQVARRREARSRVVKREWAAKKALAEKEARAERDRLAKERGGSLGKTYDQVRKLMPTIDAAISEGLTVEARALAVRLEDEIYKALKG